MRHDRRGFIFVFGTRNRVAADPAARVRADARCPRCGSVGTLAGKRLQPWFTLFFIPVAPMGGGRRFTACRQRGAQFTQAPRQLATAVARADAGQVQRGIALYNGLRASPANSVTLNELLGLYLATGEHGQAIAAAAEFPAALDASEQCMTTLGRVHLDRGDPAAAIRCFDAALARNPDCGDAHYHRAQAMAKTGRYGIAISAARAARTAGHPGADGLLRALESRTQHR